MRRIPGLKWLWYADRLSALKLFFLHRRRLWSDLIWTLKLIGGFVYFDPLSFLSLRRTTHWYWKKPFTHYDKASLIYGESGVLFNSLLADVVMAPSINFFKARLDQTWYSNFSDLPDLSQNWHINKIGILVNKIYVFITTIYLFERLLYPHKIIERLTCCFRFTH